MNFKLLFSRPMFWVAVILSATFLMFGLPILMGPGAGTVQLLLGAVWLLLVLACWFAVYRGSVSVRDGYEELYPGPDTRNRNRKL